MRTQQRYSWVLFRQFLLSHTLRRHAPTHTHTHTLAHSHTLTPSHTHKHIHTYTHLNSHTHAARVKPTPVCGLRGHHPHPPRSYPTQPATITSHIKPFQKSIKKVMWLLTVVVQLLACSRPKSYVAVIKTRIDTTPKKCRRHKVVCPPELSFSGSYYQGGQNREGDENKRA